MKSKLHRERGTSLLEYLLLAASILLICLAGVANFGTSLGTNLTNTADKVENAMSPGQ